MREYALTMEPGRYRFGLFEFNAASRELRREGVLVRLQAQPAQLLACLIERAGQTVSREDLRRALWGNDTFVDFDRGLNFCMSQVRSALRDDTAEPTYIRTIPKSGYQFIAPVERLAESRREGDRQETPAIPPMRSSSPRRIVVLSSIAAVAVVLIFAAGYRLRPGANSKPAPVVAVLRFDNETGDPAMTRFSDGLTDTVVERLTALNHGKYEVIGNAQILRLPRDQWDLTAIATSLHAGYVVVGQVQLNDGKVRILAHLIRLPEQTHLWVVRTERTLSDPLAMESEVAEKIGSEFSSRVAAGNTPPLPSTTR